MAELRITQDDERRRKRRKITQNFSSASSSAVLKSDYEVFLSFRGADTRTSITDYLYNDLISAGIRTFRDDDELQVGENIGPELIKAIQSSKICIPIFSKDYASSKWCLIELTQMMTCMKSTGQVVLPIFFDVSPSDVRHQRGSFTKAFREHEKNEVEKTVRKWRNALKEVADLKGWELSKIANGHQAALVKIVVSRVCGKLKKNYMSVTDCLVGMSHHVDQMTRYFDIGCDDVRIIGICGMGGIGKTTIAKVLYNRLCNYFDSCSFIADIRAEATQYKGLVHLQNQLITNILKHKWVQITSVDEGINVIKDRFHNVKVLIVLDDVDQKSQLAAFAGNLDWFCSGSRVIVTTRRKDVLIGHQVTSIYEPNVLDTYQSLRLFSKHAFRSDHPPENYETLSTDVVATTAGLPLSLEIIGSLLCNKSVNVWNATLKKLRNIPHADVQKTLRISYDELDYEQQQIFLDIACLFIGVDKRIAFYMWDACDFYPEDGIDTLLHMSLLKIGDDNVLWMHDQLRDLGRQIVRQENFKDPGKRSRLWSHKEAVECLHDRTGSRKVEALCLDFRFMLNENCISNRDFKDLSNLRYLQVDFSNMHGDFRGLLSKLKWLHWNGCSRGFRLTNFRPKDLVILDLSWSKISENWEGWNHMKMARMLKVLNLTGCGNLTRTPDLSTFKDLERLIIEECESLICIDSSIGHLKGLKHMNLKNCSKVSELPLEFRLLEGLTEVFLDGTSIKEMPNVSRGRLKKLETLSATRCMSLTRLSSIGNLTFLSDIAFDYSMIRGLPEEIGSLVKLRRLSLNSCLSLDKLPNTIGKLESLTELYLSLSRITELPESIGNLKNLRVLNMNASSIVELPKTIGMLEKLEEINAGVCLNLKGEIPSNIGRLLSLRILRLYSSKICSLPTSIHKLSCLQNLDLDDCKELQLSSGFKFPASLTILKITGSGIVKAMGSIMSLLNLTILCLSNCPTLVEITGNIGKLSKLETLNIYSINISSIPMEVSALCQLTELNLGSCRGLCDLPRLPPNLLKLCVRGCESLVSLPDMSNLKFLSDLIIGLCFELVEVPGLEKLESLTSFDLSECTKLAEVNGLVHLRLLQVLRISKCTSLTALPDFSNLKRLRKLIVLHCHRLTEIRGIDGLRALETLCMNWCISFETLPDLSNLEMLKSLDLLECKKLKEIKGYESLTSLKILNLSMCTSLESSLDLSQLKQLKELRVRDCKKLTAIHGFQELKCLKVSDTYGCDAHIH